MINEKSKLFENRKKSTKFLKEKPYNKVIFINYLFIIVNKNSILLCHKNNILMFIIKNINNLLLKPIKNNGTVANTSIER